MITMVAAMSRVRVIAKNGRLPWGRTILTDQRRYKAMVKNRVVVLGSDTYDPQDEYLHQAKHIFVMTSKPMEETSKLTAIHSIEPILELAKTEDVLVLGGASVFEQFMPHTNRLELTYIDADYEGDRLFPEFDENEWEMINDESHPDDAENKHNYRFVTLTRK